MEETINTSSEETPHEVTAIEEHANDDGSMDNTASDEQNTSEVTSYQLADSVASTEKTSGSDTINNSAESIQIDPEINAPLLPPSNSAEEGTSNETLIWVLEKVDDYSQAAYKHIKSVSLKAEQFIEEQPKEHIWIGTAIILFILFLLYLASRRGKKRLIIYRDNNGQIEMSRATIQKMIRDLINERDEIGSPDVRLYNKGGLICIKAHINVKTNNLPELYKETKNRVQKVLNDSIGISNIGSFHLIVRKIKTITPKQERLEAQNSDWPTLPN